MNNVHFAIPEIYGETLSYYELLRKLVNKTNELIENYNTVPDQIDEAVKNLDASQLFSAVLNQLIHSIATDNTKSTNAVKVYKKHDLLYATFNETVNLYESLIDFTTGTETELIIGTNIREVNISELLIEIRKLIDANRESINALSAVAGELRSDIANLYFSNVEEMKEANVKNGDVCKTLGYYLPNDKGSATYLITNNLPTDFHETLNNGLYAVIIGEKTTAKMGATEGSDITNLIVNYQPFMLSFNHAINLTKSLNNLTINDVEFNGYEINNISGYERASLILNTSKSNFKLKNILLAIYDCENVKVNNFEINRTIRGGCCDIVRVNYLTIDNFTIKSPTSIENTDGLHIAQGHDISISNGYLECGDDAIAIITDDYDGGTFGDVYNVTVTNVTMGDNNHSGFSYNNQTHRIDNILFENCILTSKITSPIYGLITSQEKEFTGYNGTFKFNNCILKQNITYDPGDESRRRIATLPKTKDITFSNCTMYFSESLVTSFAIYVSGANSLKITDCVVINDCQDASKSPFLLRSSYCKNITLNGIDIQSSVQNMKLAEFYDFADSVIISNIHLNKAVRAAIVESASNFVCGSMLFNNVVADNDSLLLITNSVYPVGISNCKCSTNGINVTNAYLRPLYGVVLPSGSIPNRYKAGDKWCILGTDTVTECIGTGDMTYKTIAYNN